MSILRLLIGRLRPECNFLLIRQPYPHIPAAELVQELDIKETHKVELLEWVYRAASGRDAYDTAHISMVCSDIDPNEKILPDAVKDLRDLGYVAEILYHDDDWPHMVVWDPKEDSLEFIRIEGYREEDLFDDFVTGAARALYVMAWANTMEEYDFPLGGELMDLAPQTPESADELAIKLLDTISGLNSRTILGLWSDSVIADFEAGKGMVAHTQEDFGHYLAMQAMGSGVSWFDHHEQIPIRLPLVEVYLDFDPDAAEDRDDLEELIDLAPLGSSGI